MPWVQIQKASETGWDAYERVARGFGEQVPDGLIYHAAGVQENGNWQAVSIWETQEHFNRFRDERILPLVREVLGDDLADAGPPPTESFEARHIISA